MGFKVSATRREGAGLPTDTRKPLSDRFAALFVGLIVALSVSFIVSIGTSRTVRAATAPAYTDSDYVESLNYGNWNSYGCSEVQAATAAHLTTISVILDFGQPTDSGGHYGTTIYGAGTFAVWDSNGLGSEQSSSSSLTATGIATPLVALL